VFVVVPCEDDDPEPDLDRPPGGCEANHARVSLIDVGTSQNPLSSIKDVVTGDPMTGPDTKDGGALLVLTAPGGTTTESSSRSASTWACCLLLLPLEAPLSPGATVELELIFPSSTGRFWPQLETSTATIVPATKALKMRTTV
jgi:hypothetical protein